jgi:hypothetical protein
METLIDITPKDPLPEPSVGPLHPDCAKEGLILCDRQRIKGQQGVSLDALVGIFTRLGRDMEEIGVSKSYKLAEKVASIMEEAQPLLTRVHILPHNYLQACRNAYGTNSFSQLIMPRFVWCYGQQNIYIAQAKPRGLSIRAYRESPPDLEIRGRGKKSEARKGKKQRKVTNQEVGSTCPSISGHILRGCGRSGRQRGHCWTREVAEVGGVRIRVRVCVWGFGVGELPWPTTLEGWSWAVASPTEEAGVWAAMVTTVG